MAVKVFIFAGQSNMSGYSPLINTRDDALASPYVPGYARTDSNEWTGAAPASIDSGYQYRYPKLATHPCLYIENTRGDFDGVFDAWGTYDKQRPRYPDGVLSESGSYGLELSFLQKYRQDHPSVTMAAIKQSLGGTSLRGDWLPNTVAFGTAQSGTSSSITLAASDFAGATTYDGRNIRIVSGTGAGQERTIGDYNNTTKVAPVTVNWDVTPDNTSVYGIERLQAQILRTMIGQAAARLDVSHPGDWEFAGFIWMQGESGAHTQSGIPANDNLYLTDARAFFAAVRDWTDTPDLPVIVGLVGDNWLETNPYLIAAEDNEELDSIDPELRVDARYTSIDYSITSSGQAVSETRRTNAITGCHMRRATQTTLGSDANCAWFNNDGYPTRPPFSLSIDDADQTAYHWGGPGNMAAGERAYDAYLELDPLPPAEGLFITAGGNQLNIRVGAS